jgi:aldose 1-epimerase
MSILDLTCGSLSLRASTSGGLVLGFWKDTAEGPVPLLRPAPDDDADALASSCYPLVPFGNRVKDNRFSFDGNEYRFQQNTAWDPHYLHGEGWLLHWSVTQALAHTVTLAFSHRGDGTPYAYHATQTFSLSEHELEMTLSVENHGECALPFGLGWHPYFPMTPQTTLLAPAKTFWTEVEGWLPGEATPIPADLDFSRPAPLPHRWVNNGFEDWCGKAVITWPERAMELNLDADPVFRHAFLFVSDMTHLANGHNLPGLGGLHSLKPGQQLSGRIRLRPQDL